jgi:hypothetical protein
MNLSRLPSSRRGWERLVALPLVISFLLSGCNRSDTPAAGMYRAVLELPGGEAPFGLEVRHQNGAHVLYLLNGSERARIDAVSVSDGELQAKLPSQATLTAAIYRDRLEGRVALLPGEANSIPFRASLGANYRFYAEPATDNADVEGHWRIRLTPDGSATVEGSAQLEQRFDRVVGTITTTTGIARMVEGQVNGDDIALAAFDGKTVLLYKLRVDDAGNLDGEFWQNLDAHGKFRADRDKGTKL